MVEVCAALEVDPRGRRDEFRAGSGTPLWLYSGSIGCRASGILDGAMLQLFGKTAMDTARTHALREIEYAIPDFKPMAESGRHVDVVIESRQRVYGWHENIAEGYTGRT